MLTICEVKHNIHELQIYTAKSEASNWASSLVKNRPKFFGKEHGGELPNQADILCLNHAEQEF